MEYPIEQCRLLDPEVLLSQAKALARHEREFLRELIARLAVIDEAELYRPRYSSMFEYCLKELGFSEATTYGRIRVARLARRVPVVLDLIRDGVLPLSHLEKVAAHMTRENASALVEKIRALPTREVERLVASFSPSASSPDSARARIEALAPPLEPGGSEEPVRRSGSVSPSPEGGSRDRMRWLSASKVLFRFTGTAELQEKLLRAAAILRRSGRTVRFSEVLSAALECFLSVSYGPSWSTGRRRLPRWVRRAVWRRDEGRCTWTRDGRRCEATEGLQFDHIRPISDGGSGDDPDNLRLLCPPHHVERHRIK